MADEAPPMGEVLRTRDFIGRDVLDSKGSKIGSVGDLLIDRRNGRLRFLDLDMGLIRKQHVLIPVDEMEWGRDTFVLGRWTSDDIKNLPAYDKDRPLTSDVLEEMERSHPRFYGPGDVDPPPAPGEARVVPMKQAKDFKLSKGAPDLRGWNVFGADGERVGMVSELLVDPKAMKIRYLDVDLLDDLFLLEDDRHVLVPLEMVELKERGEDVWIHRLRAEEVARLPAYTGGPLGPTIETKVRNAFAPPRRTDEVTEGE